MGLMDALRRAEEQSKDLSRRGMEAAREGIEDASRRVRRKMRIYPTDAGHNEATPDATEREMEDARRKAIVSVHGEDVEEIDLSKREKDKAA